jgi:competence protein ComEA
MYIGGAVYAPGWYPLQPGDSIEALIRAAGGNTNSANLSGLELYIPLAGGKEGPQKIDINRAEAWLLEALPGIGETLAQRIIDYRQQNGPFNNTADLLKVPGIGTTTYDRIKDLITVGDR